MRIGIPRPLYEQLRTVADREGILPEAVISNALRWYVAAAAEYERAVLEGIRAADVGEVITHEEVAADVKRRLERGN